MDNKKTILAVEPEKIGKTKCSKSCCYRIAPPYSDGLCCSCDHLMDMRVPTCKICKNFCRLYNGLFYCINSECNSFSREAYPTNLEDKHKCINPFCGNKIIEENIFCNRCTEKHYYYCSVESDSRIQCVLCKRPPIPLRS